MACREIRLPIFTGEPRGKFADEIADLPALLCGHVALVRRNGASLNKSLRMNYVAAGNEHVVSPAGNVDVLPRNTGRFRQQRGELFGQPNEIGIGL